MIRSRLVLASAAGATLALGAAAHGATFSFASDDNSSQWTFLGTAGQPGGFFDISSPLTTPVNLKVDDHNGVFNQLTVPVHLVVDLTARLANSAPLFGSVYQHSYFVDGTVRFVNPADPTDTYLTINIGADSVGPNNPGGLTTIGGVNSWGTAGAILGAHPESSVTYTASSSFKDLIDFLAAAQGQGANAGSYGIAAGSVSAGNPLDFSFTLTVVNQGDAQNTPAGPEVVLNAETHLPTTTWRSESSFSGSAIIPSPGALAMLSVAGALVARRRRA